MHLVASRHGMRAAALCILLATRCSGGPDSPPQQFDPAAQRFWARHRPAREAHQAEWASQTSQEEGEQPPGPDAGAPDGAAPSADAGCEGIEEIRDELSQLRQQIQRSGVGGAAVALQDAGSDGGALDAGAPDAGPPDAGADAALSDAGVPDAGLDAGELSAEAMRSSARQLCSQLGYRQSPPGVGGTGAAVKKEPAPKPSPKGVQPQPQSEQLNQALDRLRSAERDIERIKKNTGGSGAPDAGQPAVSDLEHHLDDLEHQISDLKKKRAEGGSGATAESPEQHMSVDGTVETSSSQRLTLRTKDGQLMVVDLGQQPNIHKGDQRKSPQDLSEGSHVHLRAAWEGGRWKASDVEIKDKPGG